MIKMNFNEHWTRVTRFNPLWVSRITNIIISILKSLVIPAFCLALSSLFYSRLSLFFALNHICSKLPHSCSKLLHFCFKSQHFWSISSHFYMYVKNKMSFKSLLFSTFQRTRIFHSLNDIRLEWVKLKMSGTVSHPEKFWTMAKFLTFEIKK